MMEKNDFIYLRHILHSMRKCVDYLDDVEYHEFLDDEEKQDSVIRKIEVIGEATKMVSQEFRNKFPSIPWRGMAGMRDKLIHGYFNVDMGTVWEVVTKDIPKLMPEIGDILHQLKEEA